MCQAGTGLRETRATRSALTFAPAGGLAELPVLSPRRNRDRSYLPEGTETGLISPKEQRPVLSPRRNRDRSCVPEGRGPVLLPEGRGTGLGSGQCRRRAQPGGRLRRVVPPTRGGLDRTPAPMTAHWLSGCDPTTGIVSIDAARQGRARVWRRSDAQGVEVTEHRFPNWFLTTSLDLLAHLPA